MSEGMPFLRKKPAARAENGLPLAIPAKELMQHLGNIGTSTEFRRQRFGPGELVQEARASLDVEASGEHRLKAKITFDEGMLRQNEELEHGYYPYQRQAVLTEELEKKGYAVETIIRPKDKKRSNAHEYSLYVVNPDATMATYLHLGLPDRLSAISHDGFLSTYGLSDLELELYEKTREAQYSKGQIGKKEHLNRAVTLETEPMNAAQTVEAFEQELQTYNTVLTDVLQVLRTEAADRIAANAT